MHKCWMKAPEKRPTFSDLVQLLYSSLLLTNRNEGDLEVEDENNVSSRRHSSVDNTEDGSNDDTCVQH